MKVNPFTFARRAYPTHSRAFADPDGSGLEVTLSLRRLGGVESALVSDHAAEVMAAYASDLPKPLRDIGVTTVSRRMIAEAATIEAMQDVGAADRYSILDMIGIMAVAPRMWEAIQTWAATIIDDPFLGANPPQAGAATSSEPALDEGSSTQS